MDSQQYLKNKIFSKKSDFFPKFSQVQATATGGLERTRAGFDHFFDTNELA